MITRQYIVDTARTMLGTPFHHQGRAPGVGLDCGGMVERIAASIPWYEYQDMRGYPREAIDDQMLRLLESNGVPVPASQRLPGTILVFWMNRVTKAAQHCAICTDRGIIHCDAYTARVVEHPLGDSMSKRVIGAVDFRGVV